MVATREMTDRFRQCIVSLLAVLPVLCSAPTFAHAAAAFSLSPRGTRYEQHVAKENSDWWQRTVMRLAREDALHLREPVHEEITSRIYGCDKDQSVCADPEVEYAGPFVLAGVRWNDAPPFQLQPGEGKHTACKTEQTIRVTTQPVCWVQIFENAKRMAASGNVPSAGNHASLLARSHFGDLQFLHAMASQDGEAAAETQRRVLMWAEFCWKVATGAYALGTRLQDVDIPGFADFFGKSGWTVQDLFTVGNDALRPHISEVAFGSVLHAVEDSFARGHVQRENPSAAAACSALPQFPAPPRILEFHSYAHQDEHKHAQADTREAFELESRTDSPSVVPVGRPLRDFFQSRASWEAVRPYFDCVFAVVDPEAKASPGAEFAAE
jgi:hypothetical protein